MSVQAGPPGTRLAPLVKEPQRALRDASTDLEALGDEAYRRHKLPWPERTPVLGSTPALPDPEIFSPGVAARSGSSSGSD